MRKAILLLLVLFLAACAPGTPDQLRREAALRTTVVVDRDLRSTYKSLRAGVDNCIAQTSSDIFESEGTAWIKYVTPGLSGHDVLLYYDLNTIAPNRTQINGYAAFKAGSWSSTLSNTERWAKGDTSCP